VPPAHFDWHQFRLDQAHTGFNRFEHVLNVANVPSLSNSWQAQLGDIVFSSSPAVVGGVVYIGSMDGTLWAYPADGCGADLCETPLWQSTNLAQIIDSPTVADGIVYVGSQTSFDSNDGRLSAFDARGCGAPVCAPLWQGGAGQE
jgi:outer membrane protein assembly factor BamB